MLELKRKLVLKLQMTSKSQWVYKYMKARYIGLELTLGKIWFLTEWPAFWRILCAPRLSIHLSTKDESISHLHAQHDSFSAVAAKG